MLRRSDSYLLCIVLLGVSLSATAVAAPVIAPGDAALRHDLQLLADYGAISGPVTTWPISWDAVLGDLESAKAKDIGLPANLRPTYERMLAKARRETARDEVRFNARIGVAEAPVDIRGFADSPREEGEIRAGR